MQPSIRTPEDSIHYAKCAIVELQCTWTGCKATLNSWEMLQKVGLYLLYLISSHVPEIVY